MILGHCRKPFQPTLKCQKRGLAVFAAAVCCQEPIVCRLPPYPDLSSKSCRVVLTTLYTGQLWCVDRHCFVFACSHGGDVVCLDGSTGARVWEACLPGHLDAGPALSQDLKAGWPPWSLFLDLTSGFQASLQFGSLCPRLNAGNWWHS